MQETIRRLHPDPRRKIRASLRELRTDPNLGEELGGDLAGMRRMAVGRLRVVYRASDRGVQIVAVGPRAVIYIELEREARRSRGAPADH